MSVPSGPVLVVDDDEAVRRSLKFALELEGLDVRLYTDAAHLLGETSLPGTGCLVVDQHMPGMDGIELVGQLRGREVGLPAILVTARPSEDLQQRARRAGFLRVVEKPFEDGSLLAGIQDALAASTP
ncbi:response regulator transcription factor [Methylobacterium sp. CM6257]|jgi:FixJ family two-component response regulator